MTYEVAVRAEATLGEGPTWDPVTGDLYITTARVGLEAPHPVAGSLLVVPGAGKGVRQPPFAG